VFTAKGDRPQWAVVYERLVEMRVGQVITDQELRDLLPEAAEASIPGAVTRAVKELEDEHRRTFARVRHVGYRMVEAAEHEVLARGQHKKARRSLGRAWRKAHSADRSKLSQEQRRRLDAVEDHLGRQQEMIKRLDRRVDQIDHGLKQARRDQRKDAAELSERVDRLADLLARHGIADPTREPANH
jgi:hypothetical protein